MERTELDELARSIEARQARLAGTVAELKHEAKPAVIAGHAAQSVKQKAASLVITPAGQVRAEAIVAGVVLVCGAAAAIIFSRR